MSLNKVMLIGRLGRDPEVRYMPNGDAVCNFSVATSETWNDRNSGQRQERTEWHNITMYRRQAEIAGQYLKKGSQVYLEGRIQSRKYTDKQGVERTAYDIVCDVMRMLDSKNSQGSYSAYDMPDDSGYQEYNKPPRKPAQTAPVTEEPPAAPKVRHSNPPVAPAAPIEDIEEDIPF